MVKIRVAPLVFEICRFLTSIWGGLFSISLNLHTTGDLRVGFSTGKISHMDESVVVGCEEMENTEVVLVGDVGLWWTEVGNLLFSLDSLLWWLLKATGLVTNIGVFCLPFEKLSSFLIKQ